MPRDLARWDGDGVGVYWERVAPTEFAEHAHPEVEVAMSFGRPAGPAVWQTATGREVTHRMREGYVSVLPSGQPHSGVWEREAEVLIFYLDPRFLLDAARESVGENTVELAGAFTTGDDLTRQLGLALRRELAGGEPPGRLYVESVANVLAVHLLRRYGAAGTPLHDPPGGLAKGALRQAVEYAHENFARDLSLSEMAREAAMSPYHFSRLFKGATGRTPHQYVIQLRVQRAKHLLLTTDWPLDRISRGAGFANRSHLSRHFKRLLGVTPGSLR